MLKDSKHHPLVAAALILLVLYFLPAAPPVVDATEQSSAPLAAGAADPLSAPSSYSVCNQAEIVFLIDQSGSMGGKPYGSITHPSPNDPLELRFWATIHAMQKLGSRYVSRRGIPGRDPITFSMAVVDFGDSANPALGWSPLAPKDEASWNALNESLTAQLLPSRLAGRSLGDTNFVTAFQRADALFKERGSLKEGCPTRAIVLLTDGEPYQRAANFGIANHMAQVQDIVRQGGYRLYVTGINDPDKPDSWSIMEPYWRSIAQYDPSADVPRVQLAVTRDQIADRFSKIMFDLEGTIPPPPPPRAFDVEPYMQQVCITFFKRDISEHLAIRDEKGPLDPTRSDIEIRLTGFNLPIETVCGLRPAPGKWQLDTTASRDDVIMEADPIPTAALFRPPAGAGPVQFVRTQVEFQLVDSAGRPLPDYGDPKYSLQISGTISAAGRSWPASFSPGSTPQSFKADFVPVESGQHTISLQGATQGVSKPLIEVMNGPVGQFTVAPAIAEPVSLPNAYDACGGPQVGMAINLAYRLRGPGGQNVIPEIPIRWDATVASGGRTWPVKIEGPDEKGLYKGAFVPEISGAHQLVVKATAIEPVGAVERKLYDYQTNFNVAPTVGLGIKLVRPEPGQATGSRVVFQWMPPLIRFAPDPLSVEAHLVKSGDGQLTDPATVAAVSPEKLLRLDVLASSTGQNVPVAASLKPVGAPGQYRAMLEGLDSGKYQIGVRPSGEVGLRCGFAWTADIGGAGGTVEAELGDDPNLRNVLIGAAAAIVLLTAFWWRLLGLLLDPMNGFVGVVNNNTRQPLPGATLTLSGRHERVYKNLPSAIRMKEFKVRRLLAGRALLCRRIKLISLTLALPLLALSLFVYPEVVVAFLLALGIALAARLLQPNAGAETIRVTFVPFATRPRSISVRSSTSIPVDLDHSLVYELQWPPRVAYAPAGS